MDQQWFDMKAEDGRNANSNNQTPGFAGGI
jgi:hypothetical protein